MSAKGLPPLPEPDTRPGSFISYPTSEAYYTAAQMTAYALRANVDLAAESERLQDVLLRNGFVQCDIAACNCGSWHARFGYPERIAEIRDALQEAGHPVCNDNGNLISKALAGLVGERDSLRAALEGLLHRHNDGSAEAHWAEWDTALAALKEAP